MKRMVIQVVLGLFLFAGLSSAQEAARPEPTFMAINFNKVKMMDMSALRKMWFEQAVPILDDLKKEGKLLDYGLMQHAWGDEWNYNFYFVTKSHEDYLVFWDEYIGRMREKHPDSLGEYLGKILEHKDNLYTLYR